LLSSANVYSLPPLLASSSSSAGHDTPSLITYRSYATLSFIIISTSTESPLGLLDLIQCFVEALDRLFEDVCEYDLIFNFETLHAMLAEMIVGGIVVDTDTERIVQGVIAQGKIPKRPRGETSLGSAVGSAVGRVGVLGGFRG
jgi:AP-3 complex subunit sigma